MSLTEDLPGRFAVEEYREQADFRRGLRAYFHVSEENARAAGVAPQQFLSLLIIRGHPSYPRVSITEFARSMQIRQSSASLLIDRAVRAGLLNRVEDQGDRRKVQLSLTEQGQVILDQIMRANRMVLGDAERHLLALDLSEQNGKAESA